MKIALFGKIRSGKDTVGNILIEKYKFNRFAFGDGIGKIIEKYFPEAWETGKPRKHYQHIGQELRVLNPDVWINYLVRTVEGASAKHIESYHSKGVLAPVFNVVITDGRQVNEAEKLREQGYLIIKVECPEQLRVERMKNLGDNFQPEQLYHDTELQVDRIEADVTIENSGTLEELEEKVSRIVKGYEV